jgi:MEMO1 family protein
VIQEARKSGNACCAGAAAAAIAAGKKMGAVHALEIGYATSYEKSPGDSFVGYTGIVF